MGGGRSATPGESNMKCQNRNQNLWNCCSTGVDLPPLVGQIWAVRIEIKICEIAILLGGGRSATPSLPNISCQNRNHIWPTRGGRSTPVEQQFHRFWFLFWHFIFDSPGVADLPPPIEWQFHRFWFLFWQLKICEIAILMGGSRSATPGWPNMSCENRNQNLWNCCSTWGRSATPGQSNMKC